MIPPFPLEQALALSTEAGWNQTLGDWQRIVRLAPAGCFGIEAEGRLAATAVALIHDPALAWIGMVLTTEQQRGKGFARRLMLQSLEHCDAAGIVTVKLDATDLGRPVYAKLGFVEERPVSRWLRPGGMCPEALHTDQQVDLKFDREAFGADRSALLQALAEHEVYAIAGQGQAFARPGRRAWHFGPAIARDPQTAAALLQAFLHRHGDEPALLDLCDDHPHAAAIATAAGFAPVRRLMRMYRGPHETADVGSGAPVYMLAGFEYG